jgi:L,D-transpeptidase YbiS
MKLSIDISQQLLKLYKGDSLINEYPVSTAKNGAGEEKGTEKTPRGKHIIRAKIGADMPINTIFVGRRPLQEIYQPGMMTKYPDRDWILSRIMWLSGTEIGKNRLGKYDSMQRYIYIHGTPDEVSMAEPGSHGCIRMHNQSLIELFQLAPVGCEVTIG